LSTVSREIERRIPTAAKLMMRDDPPALMNGRVIPVIGRSATTQAQTASRCAGRQPRKRAM